MPEPEMTVLLPCSHDESTELILLMNIRMYGKQLRIRQYTRPHDSVEELTGIREIDMAEIYGYFELSTTVWPAGAMTELRIIPTDPRFAIPIKQITIGSTHHKTKAEVYDERVVVTVPERSHDQPRTLMERSYEITWPANM